MITLTTPLSVTPPPITHKDGTVKTFETIVLPTIDYIVTYDNTRKVASAIIKGVNRHLSLWTGDAYDAAGQFTDSDVEARIINLLGADPTVTLTSLFQPVRVPSLSARK